MRKTLIIILTLIVFKTSGQTFTFGQAFSYPNIDILGNNLNNFIPNGWTLLDSTQGDINKDNHNDIALIIQYKDSVSLMKKEFDNSDTVKTQPRVLIILFYNPTTNKYQLAEQSNSFILNHDNSNMENPYRDISINKGVLKIDFHIFMNIGGWGMSDNSYKFRFQDNDFVLIGADYDSAQRNTGETENRSYNFLTKKVKIETGNFSSDKQNVKWRKFELPKLKTLKTFTRPFTWEVERNFYL